MVIMFIFILLINWSVAITYYDYAPSPNDWLPANNADSIIYNGSDTGWTNLPRCTGFDRLNACQTIRTVSSETALLRLTNFRLPQSVHPDFPIIGIAISLLYSSTDLTAEYEINNMQMYMDGPVGVKTVGSFNNTNMCCNQTVFGGQFETWGLNLTSSMIAKTTTGYQFTVKRISDSENGRINIYEALMRTYYGLDTTILSIDPTQVSESESTTITIFGSGFLDIYGQGVRCKVGDITFTGTIVNNTHIICPYPGGQTGLYDVEISLDNGILYTDNAKTIRVGPVPTLSPTLSPTNEVSCSLGNAENVVCNTDINVISGDIIVDIDSDVIGLEIIDRGSITALNSTITLSGILYLTLSTKPEEDVNVFRINALNIVGDFSEVVIHVPDLLECEKSVTDVDNDGSNLSVIVSINKNECNLGLIIGVSCGAVLLGILVGVIICSYYKYKTIKITNEMSQELKDKDFDELKRTMAKAR
jgi:hypothetical protein